MSELGKAPYWGLLIVLSLALIFVIARFRRGPALADRVVAFDMIASIFIGITGLTAIAMDSEVVIDVLIVLALLSFLGTVGFAYYLETRGPER